MTYTWELADIRPGGQAHTGNGEWTRRCWDAECDVTWVSADGPWPMFILEQAQHGATHPGAQIPGYNVAILSR